MRWWRRIFLIIGICYTVILDTWNANKRGIVWLVAGYVALGVLRFSKQLKTRTARDQAGRAAMAIHAPAPPGKAEHLGRRQPLRFPKRSSWHKETFWKESITFFKSFLKSPIVLKLSFLPFRSSTDAFRAFKLENRN